MLGTIDRIDNGNAYIIVEDGMIEISVPIQALKGNQYKVGDEVTISIYDNMLNMEKKYA